MKQERRPNIIKDKSFTFAVAIVLFARQLRKERSEFVLSGQLLRSGTSIGANVEEALGGQSRRDFVAKMSIAAKEARETHYWLRLVRDAAGLKTPRLEMLLCECSELLAVLNSIILTTRQKSPSRNSANSEFRIHHSELEDGGSP